MDFPWYRLPWRAVRSSTHLFSSPFTLFPSWMIPWYRGVPSPHEEISPDPGQCGPGVFTKFANPCFIQILPLYESLLLSFSRSPSLSAPMGATDKSLELFSSPVPSQPVSFPRSRSRSFSQFSPFDGPWARLVFLPVPHQSNSLTHPFVHRLNH